MQLPIMSYPDTAAFFRTALLLGLVSPPSVIAWADGVIQGDSVPPPAIFDVALAGAELTAVRMALQPLATDPEPWSVLQAVLALAARDLGADRRTVDDTMRVLAQFRRLPAVPGSVEAELDVLEDDHMLAQAGVQQHDLAEVRGRIRAWLEPFARLEVMASHGGVVVSRGA